LKRGAEQQGAWGEENWGNENQNDGYSTRQTAHCTLLGLHLVCATLAKVNGAMERTAVDANIMVRSARLSRSLRSILRSIYFGVDLAMIT
jgi:hypothetical protein